MCTPTGALGSVLIETMSVRETREQLPSVLERFCKGDLTPVGVGSHRKTEAVLFCLTQHITTYAADVFTAREREHHLRGLSRDRFVDRVTHYLAEVNALHPFREGTRG
jgi:fido (protein-threonine AMPylation protein)